MPKFIKTKLQLNSESDLDSDLEKMESKIDNELEPGSDSKQAIIAQKLLQIKMILIIHYK